MIRNYISMMIVFVVVVSCSSRNITEYYYRNQPVLDSIHANYKSLIKENGFTLFFKDRSYKSITLEIFTDSLKYIYYFKINEARLYDTLLKYKFKPYNFYLLMNDMIWVRSLWVAKLDYYVGNKKENLIYISFRSRPVRFFFSQQKYFMINWFQKPQYYDHRGILLDEKLQPAYRELNDRISHRINDTVAYRISNRFR